MSLRTAGLDVEIAVSNMDLYPLGEASWVSELEQLVPYLDETNSCNFEIHPTRAILWDIERRIRSGRPESLEIVDELVGSLHQTFNDSRDMLGMVATLTGVQQSQASVFGMAAIQSALPHSVPGVYYVDKLPSPGELTRRMRVGADESRLNRLDAPLILGTVQPAAELYRDYQIGSDDALIYRMGELGIIGLCPDTVHARRQAEDGTKPPRFQDVWEAQFASGRVMQMHVSADRVDMGKRDAVLARTSVQEFEAFTSRDWLKARYTDMGDMITAAVEQWVAPPEIMRAYGRPVLRMVIEIPPRPSQVRKRVPDHARFVNNLAEVVAAAGARPLLRNAA